MKIEIGTCFRVTLGTGVRHVWNAARSVPNADAIDENSLCARSLPTHACVIII
jgi:hypothetical protein